MTNHLLFILLILVIIVLIKFYLESNHSNYSNHSNRYKNIKDTINTNSAYDNSKYEKMLEEVNRETIKKINQAVEQGYKEGFEAMNNEVLEVSEVLDNTKDLNGQKEFEQLIETGNAPIDDIKYTSDFKVKSIKKNSSKYKEHYKNKNNNDNIISYLNKGNSTKVMLFYKASCHYCSEFMPVWYKIVNNLSNNVLYEEIECEKDFKKANEYQISSVPTIILLVNNEKKVYIGEKEYSNIMKFLKYNGVNLVERSFEEFDSTGYDIPKIPTGNDYNNNRIKNDKNMCPIVTFDSQLDIANNNYMFQIFNADGQYGYALGSNKGNGISTNINNSTLSPFNAAYSTVDSYLSSLPDGANISECANTYSNQIRGFGLCDKTQLNNILQYQTTTKNGTAIPRFDGTDYSTNKQIVTAIKNVCKL